MCPIVFVLCVPAYGAVPRLVFVLSYVMVEKAESFLRGQWFAFNIYRAVSFLFSLCFSFSRLVVGFSSWHVAVSSRFVLVSCSWRMRVCGDVVRVASHVGSILSRLLIAIVYLVVGVLCRPFAHRLVLISFRLAYRYPWREGGSYVAWRGCPCHHVIRGGRGSVPVFLIGLTGEGHEATGVRRFIQLILIHIHGGVFVLMV